MGGSFLSCDASKNGSDSHPHPGKITLTENAARHDFTSRPDIFQRPFAATNLGVAVNLQAKIGEGYTRAQNIAIKRRLDNRTGPVGLGRVNPVGGKAVELGGMKIAWRAGSILS